MKLCPQSAKITGKSYPAENCGNERCSSTRQWLQAGGDLVHERERERMIKRRERDWGRNSPTAVARAVQTMVTGEGDWVATMGVSVAVDWERERVRGSRARGREKRFFFPFFFLFLLFFSFFFLFLTNPKKQENLHLTLTHQKPSNLNSPTNQILVLRDLNNKKKYIYIYTHN